MSERKVLQISEDEANYLDPNQIASIQMVDGTTIIVQGNEVNEGFVEEAQPDEQQYQTQDGQQGEQPKLRGRGVLGALAGVAAGTALLGTAAAIGGAMRRPYGIGPWMGPPLMMGPPPPPMFGPRFHPYMMGRPMFF